ncbi:MAG: hypothetical protein JEZ06_01495 [Anaerolineaceae bacterium]|nr:hypothetical protein [Anaerolineaceae bacterium]
MKNKVLINQILKAVALGMSTAVVVLGILKALNSEASIVMLAIGLFALSLANLQTKV